MVKLNNKGFSFHIVLPILALLAVGSIGAYMTFRSSAAVPPEGWTTIKTVTGTWKMYPEKHVNITSASIKTVSGVKYRLCAVMRNSVANSTMTLFAKPTTAGAVGGNYGTWIDGVGTTYRTRCSQSWGLRGYTYYASPGNSTKGILTVTKVYWQRYY